MSSLEKDIEKLIGDLSGAERKTKERDETIHNLRIQVSNLQRAKPTTAAAAVTVTSNDYAESQIKPLMLSLFYGDSAKDDLIAELQSQIDACISLVQQREEVTGFFFPTFF